MSPEQGLCDQAFIVFSQLVKIFHRKLTHSEVLKDHALVLSSLKELL